MYSSNQIAKNLVQRWLDDRSTGIVVRKDSSVVKTVERLFLLKESAARGASLDEQIGRELAMLPVHINAVSPELRLDEQDGADFARWMNAEIKSIMDGKTEAASHWR